MITKQLQDRLRRNENSDVKWCALGLVCFCFLFGCIVYNTANASDGKFVKVWDGAKYMSHAEVDAYIARLEDEVTRLGGDTAEIATQR